MASRRNAKQQPRRPKGAAAPTAPAPTTPAPAVPDSPMVGAVQAQAADTAAAAILDDARQQANTIINNALQQFSDEAAATNKANAVRKAEADTRAQQILATARREAEQTLAEATAQAAQIRAAADNTALDRQADAELAAQRTTQTGKDRAQRLLEQAQADADQMIADAQTEARRHVNESITASSRTVDAAKAEAARIMADARQALTAVTEEAGRTTAAAAWATKLAGYDTDAQIAKADQAAAEREDPDGVTKDPRTVRALAVVSAIGATALAGFGFTGSYHSVRALAEAKGFGWFAQLFPIGIDAGIIVLIALDLFLTHKRMKFPPLRWLAWLLTAATIGFNAASGAGPILADPVAAFMHAAIPILFVASTEAARHYIGTLAKIQANKHIEGPPLLRWLLNPPGTFLLWRRQILWQVTSYEDVLALSRDAVKFRYQLLGVYGKGWKKKARAHELEALYFAKFGTPIAQTLTEHAQKVEAEHAQKAETETSARETETTQRAPSETGETQVSPPTETSRRRGGDRETETTRETNRKSPQGETGNETSTTETTSTETTETSLPAPRTAAETTAPVSSIGDRETEIGLLVDLMRSRGSATKVSLTDAIDETKRPKATAAKRLKAARDQYLAETA